jgi:hypothetical protein
MMAQALGKLEAGGFQVGASLGELLIGLGAHAHFG